MLTLTPQEAQIFDTVRAALREARLTDTVVRVAGGWVRDKILQRNSHDIDLVVNNITGQALAQAVNHYLQQTGQQTSSVFVVPENPKKSKHLETATFRIHGHDVDVTHLRTETYDEKSRIPRIAWGTPLQDANRRDFTINALFYNIHTKEVEDWTGLGRQDLRDGIIRNPVSSFRTLEDDPLRLLRAIRFAVRFGFAIHSELADAAANVRIRDRLEQTVSRERIGMEVQKMLAQGRVVSSFRYMVDFNVFPVVFTRIKLWRKDPVYSPFPFFANDVSQLTEQELGRACLRVLDTAQQSASASVQSSEWLFAAFTAVFFGYANLDLKDPVKRGIPYEITRSLKWTKRQGCTVMRLLISASAFVRILQTPTEWDAPSLPPELRLRIGRCMREAEACWEPALELAHGLARSCITDRVWPSRFLKAWIHNRSGLIGCHLWQPFVHGNEIRSRLGFHGKEIGECIQRQIDWRLLHPFATEEEGRECIRAWALAQPCDKKE